MLLWTEESFFLPPLIPAGLHIFWTVRGWEQRAGICKDIKTLLSLQRQQVDKLMLENAITFLWPGRCLSSVHYLLLLTPFHCFIFSSLETKNIKVQSTNRTKSIVKSFFYTIYSIVTKYLIHLGWRLDSVGNITN